MPAAEKEIELSGSPEDTGGVSLGPLFVSRRDSESPEGERDLEKAVVEAPVLAPEDGPQSAAKEQAEDPNVVTWEGPDDPENPLNWTKVRRWGTVIIVSALTFLTPFASSMFAPGVPDMMAEFGSDDRQLESLVISVFVLGFAFGPLVIAPLSEMYGRLPLYHICNFMFIVFTIACGLSKNLGMIIVFRFLQGTFGASPLALGGGTIADLIPIEHRGTAMGIWFAGPTTGPAIGPVVGGYLSQGKGWRWNFWILAIIAGAFSLMCAILMKETYATAILERKTRRLRKKTGNQSLRSKLDSGLAPKDLFLLSIVRPSKMLMFSPIVQLVSLYMAVTYAYIYLLFTTFSTVYTTQYNFSAGSVGLSFIGIGAGALLGQLVTTYFGNLIAHKHMAKGDFKPEHRLPMMIPGAIMIPAGLFWYGWTAETKAHWILPILGTGLVGFGMMLTFMPSSTYLVDCFTLYAASAMAAVTVLRSLVAALLPMAGQSMYRALGYGWGNSLLGFIAAALIPVPLLFLRYGEKIRTKYPVKL